MTSIEAFIVTAIYKILDVSILFNMLTGCHILVCCIGRAVWWRLLQVGWAVKIQFWGKCALLFLPARAACFLASSWRASRPEAWSKTEFDVLCVMLPLSSDNFFFFFFFSFFTIYTFPEGQCFWTAFFQRKLVMGI